MHERNHHHRPTTLEERAKYRAGVEAQILRGLHAADKTHGFDTEHDPGKPITHFFQETHEGLVLFVIFFTQACRWMRCTGCTLPSTSALRHIDFGDIMDQTHKIFTEPDVLARAHEIRKVIVSNQGSVLDEVTFPTSALIHFVAKCNKHLPNMSVLTLESRPEYVDDVELDILARALDEGKTPTTLEIAVGVEVFDNDIRNLVFGKGLRLKTLDELIVRLAKHGFRLKCYFMFKPVIDEHMTREQAVHDIHEAIRYLSDLLDRVPGSAISIHLNPTYAARGTPLAIAFTEGKYTPPYLSDVVRAVRFGKDRGIPIFVGLNEEGLAVEGGSFIRLGDDDFVRTLNEFNKTQDYSLFKHLPG